MNLSRTAVTLISALAAANALPSDASLVWAQRDNGKDIDWDGARQHCVQMGKGWRLPTVAELTALAFSAQRSGASTRCGPATCFAPAGLALTAAWFWSGAEVGNDADREAAKLAWGVTLATGRATKAFRQADYGSRALCVHPA